MNHAAVKRIFEHVRRLRPEGARVTSRVVSRKARRWLLQYKKMPSDAQIRAWFQKRVAKEAATLPVKPKPVDVFDTSFKNAPAAIEALNAVPVPWYRRLWRWVVRMVMR